jgi:hypothetical protein
VHGSFLMKMHARVCNKLRQLPHTANIYAAALRWKNIVFTRPAGRTSRDMHVFLCICNTVIAINLRVYCMRRGSFLFGTLIESLLLLLINN